MDPFNAFNLSPTSMDSTSMPGTAASRQKSCNACVRGKRRCDKSYPKCTRCAAKGLDCVYHKVPPVRPVRATSNHTTAAGNISHHHHLHTAPAVTVQDSPEDGSGSDHDPHPDFDMDGLDFVGFGSSSSGPHSSSSGSTSATPGTLELDSTNLDFSVVDLLNGADVPGSSIWSLPPFGEPKADFPAPIHHMPTLQPRAQVIRRDLSALACNNNEDECLTVDPLLIHDPQSRVGFVLKYITNLHLTFAQTRALPFLHTRLYRSNLPRTVMSAFCAATTYANRTESTKAWTYNLVAQATSDIQKDGAKAETVMDKLARTQALVIVETIRVFDGDFSLRHSAGKDRHILLEWHHELDRIREDMEIELGTPDVASREHPPATWDVSIFASSYWTPMGTALTNMHACTVMDPHRELAPNLHHGGLFPLHGAHSGIHNSYVLTWFTILWHHISLLTTASSSPDGNLESQHVIHSVEAALVRWHFGRVLPGLARGPPVVHQRQQIRRVLAICATRGSGRVHEASPDNVSSTHLLPFN
jgi:hypothetical protein